MQSETPGGAGQNSSPSQETAESESEYPLYIWKMVVPGTRLRTWVVAIHEGEVREVLKDLRVDGEKEPLSWVVEDVTPLEATPHVVCVADGGDIGVAKENDFQ